MLELLSIALTATELDFLAQSDRSTWQSLDVALCLSRYQAVKLKIRGFMWRDGKCHAIKADLVKALLPALAKKPNADFTPLPFTT